MLYKGQTELPFQPLQIISKTATLLALIYLRFPVGVVK